MTSSKFLRLTQIRATNFFAALTAIASLGVAGNAYAQSTTSNVSQSNATPTPATAPASVTAPTTLNADQVAVENTQMTSQNPGWEIQTSTMKEICDPHSPLYYIPAIKLSAARGSQATIPEGVAFCALGEYDTARIRGALGYDNSAPVAKAPIFKIIGSFQDIDGHPLPKQERLALMHQGLQNSGPGIVIEDDGTPNGFGGIALPKPNPNGVVKVQTLLAHVDGKTTLAEGREREAAFELAASVNGEKVDATTVSATTDTTTADAPQTASETTPAHTLQDVYQKLAESDAQKPATQDAADVHTQVAQATASTNAQSVTSSDNTNMMSGSTILASQTNDHIANHKGSNLIRVADRKLHNFFAGLFSHHEKTYTPTQLQSPTTTVASAAAPTSAQFDPAIKATVDAIFAKDDARVAAKGDAPLFGNNQLALQTRDFRAAPTAKPTQTQLIDMSLTARQAHGDVAQFNPLKAIKALFHSRTASSAPQVQAHAVVPTTNVLSAQTHDHVKPSLLRTARLELARLVHFVSAPFRHHAAYVVLDLSKNAQATATPAIAAPTADQAPALAAYPVVPVTKTTLAPLMESPKPVTHDAVTANDNSAYQQISLEWNDANRVATAPVTSLAERQKAQQEFRDIMVVLPTAVAKDAGRTFALVSASLDKVANFYDDHGNARRAMLQVFADSAAKLTDTVTARQILQFVVDKTVRGHTHDVALQNLAALKAPALAPAA